MVLCVWFKCGFMRIILILNKHEFISLIEHWRGCQNA